MSESVLRVGLGELSTARLICADCGTAVEILVENLIRGGERLCPNCGRIWSEGGARHFDDLARAIKNLNRHSDDVKVEFVIPQPPK